jgi:hypothetical protein
MLNAHHKSSATELGPLIPRGCSQEGSAREQEGENNFAGSAYCVSFY